MAIHSRSVSLGLHALAVLCVLSNSPTALAFVPSSSQGHQQPNHRTFASSPAMAPARLPYSTLSASTPSSPSSVTTTTTASPAPRDRGAERRAWVERSLQYYSKVMREERRRALGQLKTTVTTTTADYHPDDDFIHLAGKHYFALCKIKDGKPAHAESIYRRIIDELVQQNESEHGECDHAQLAVTTLLLALLLQGQHHPPGRAEWRPATAKQTRSVFLHFFRVISNSQDKQCACSAKVLQAFALFEMKQGNALKSLFIVQKAVQLDPALRPVLKWKLFRDAAQQQQQQQQQGGAVRTFEQELLNGPNDLGASHGGPAFAVAP